MRMDESKIIGVIFIDFKRTFKTVNRRVMISKLGKYGIGGKV